VYTIHGQSVNVREVTLQHLTSENRDLEKQMWTAGYKYSWKKMEAAAQNRAEMDAYALPGSTRLKSAKTYA